MLIIMAKRKTLPEEILDLEYQIERREKKRFVDLNEEDEETLIGQQENVNTCKKTAVDVNCFKVRSTQHINIAEISSY